MPDGSFHAPAICPSTQTDPKVELNKVQDRDHLDATITELKFSLRFLFAHTQKCL